MTDRTGGPTSPNYVHRRRPESYEEEDEQGSEGEEVVALKARVKDPNHPDTDDEDDRLSRQDLALARSLRVRAEGLEKVVISMLERPPPIHPINEEEILTPPTSPKNTASHLSHPHRLPNGVRLRLALGTIINDLFARQAPPPPYRHTHAPSAKIAATPPDHASSVPSLTDLPDSVSILAPVSGAFVVPRPPPSAPQRAMQSPQFPDYSYTPTHQQQYSQPGTSHIHMQYQPMQQQQQPQQPSFRRPHGQNAQLPLPCFRPRQLSPQNQTPHSSFVMPVSRRAP